MNLPSTSQNVLKGTVSTAQDAPWIKASKTYKVPTVTLNDPANRSLRVITIGGGVSGIMMAYKIDQECKFVEQVVYERNPEIGGT